jgi:formylmethanofuran dehydrogenase subunit E
MQDFVLLNARDGLSEEEKQNRIRVRDESVRQILEMPEEELIRMTEPREVLPPMARIRSSGICKQCGERVMENRLTIVDDEPVCRSCISARSGLELR